MTRRRLRVPTRVASSCPRLTLLMAMNIHIQILVLILTGSACVRSTAAEVSLSLAQTAGYTRQHNPELRAARLRIDEARGRLLGSGRFANPEIGAEFMHDFRFE